MTGSGIIARLHIDQHVKEFQTYHIIFTISRQWHDSSYRTYPPGVSHSFSSALMSTARIVLGCPPKTFQPESFNEDEHQCQNILHFSPSLDLCCSPLLSASVRLACSPALWAGVWGLYIGGAAWLGDSIAPCVYVCVAVCQLVCACVGWSVVSLSLLCVTHADTLALAEGVAVV